MHRDSPLPKMGAIRGLTCGFGCRTVRKCVNLPRFSDISRPWVSPAHSQAEGPRLRGLSAVARIDWCFLGPNYCAFGSVLQGVA